jgi:hypothetical protein
MKEYIKKLLRENLIIESNYSLTNKKKDILDDITDEKIGEVEYQQFKYNDDLGGVAFGNIEISKGNKIAQIISMRSQPHGSNDINLKRRGFFRGLINQLKKDNVQSIKINLQSSDTRNALIKLVNDGTLSNPRELTGVSTDKHPTLFDIN